MNEKVYTIYDNKAEAWLQPFHSATLAAAIRSITQAVNDPKSNLCQHPGDYEVFEIGEWDLQKGNYTMYETKKQIGLATQFKNMDPQMNLFDRKPKLTEEQLNQ